MRISTNTAAKVAYKIQINNRDGKMIEFADSSNPRLLIFGNNSLIPGLEVHMNGLSAGDDFEFSLTPEESFGNYRDDLVVDVPKTAFVIDGKLKEDLLYIENEISMLDNNGNVVSGRVVNINTDKVKMDFNHKLAGKHLLVSGSIEHVREITDDDLKPAEGCGSGCGCASNNEQSNLCGTKETNEHEHVYDEDCPSCGNPAELRGKGHGNCGCG